MDATLNDCNNMCRREPAALVASNFLRAPVY